MLPPGVRAQAASRRRKLLAVQRLDLAEPRPAQAVGRDESEADHGHNETAGHVGLVGDVTHQFRQHRAAHDGHDNEGRSLFRPRRGRRFPAQRCVVHCQLSKS